MPIEAKPESPVATMPPYIPFETFSNFLGRLKDTTVPTHIDKTMMSNISGSLQTYLLASMRFLGLTRGKTNEVTTTLEKLVESHGTGGYKGTLGTVITDAYADTIGAIDLTRATAKQLEDAFTKHNLDGVVRDRAVRFYLKGLREAGIPFSPLLGARKPKSRSGNGRTNKPNPAAKPGEQENARGKADHTPPDLIKFPLPLGDSGASICVPRGMTIDQMPVVTAMVSAIEAMAKQNSAAKEKK